MATNIPPGWTPGKPTKFGAYWIARGMFGRVYVGLYEYDPDYDSLEEFGDEMTESGGHVIAHCPVPPSPDWPEPEPPAPGDVVDTVWGVPVVLAEPGTFPESSMIVGGPLIDPRELESE